MVKTGDAVVFVTPVGQPIPALVTAVWPAYKNVDGQSVVDEDQVPMLNVVFIAVDDNKKDPYGRQMEHATSIPHQTRSTAHGFYWREANDTSPLNPVRPAM